MYVHIDLCIAAVLVYPPDKFVSVPGGNATFICSSPSGARGNTITKVQWLVNGSLFDPLDLLNVSTDFFPFSNGFGILSFTNLPVEYNMTTIRCRAYFGFRTLTSNNATLLLLQGINYYSAEYMYI